MKRITVAIQIALALALTGLWLHWNPVDERCDDCGEGVDVFADAKLLTASTGLETPDVAPEIEYGGCVSTRLRSDGEIECIHSPESALRVWIVHPRVDEARLEVDGRRWPASPYTVEEEPGLGLRIELPTDAQRLLIRLPEQDPWSLELRAETRLSLDERRHADALMEASEPLEARLFRGDTTALPKMEALIQDTIDRGLLDDAVRLGTAASYLVLNGANRPELAKHVLGLVGRTAKRYPEGHAFFMTYHGNIAWAEGEHVEAALAYRAGGRYAVRVDSPALKIDALATYARALAELGYFEAAAHWGALAVDAARLEGRVADFADVLEAVAEANLRLRQAGQTHYDPEPLLRESMELFGPEGLDDDRETGDARSLLAELAVMNEEPTVALEMLEGIDLRWRTADRIAAIRDLEWQVLWMNDAPSAKLRESLAKLDDAADESIGDAPRLRAAVHRGMLLEQEGDLDGARAAYEVGEDILDRLIPLAALGVSGERLASRWDEVTWRLARLLIEQDRADEALCVMRQARARIGRLALLHRRFEADARSSLQSSIEEYRRAKRSYETLASREATVNVEAGERARRRAAKLRQELDRFALEILATRGATMGRPSCSDLAPRRPGELLLGLYPHRDELLVLAADDQGVTARTISDDQLLVRSDDAVWAGSLLFGPLDERLAGASRVRVLAAGKGAAIDVHRLAWRGRPLGLQLPIVYGLELPLRNLERSTASRSALVVADPYADGTQVEATRVANALRLNGWAVLRQDSASLESQELRDELALVDLFHYAGHAYYDVPGMRAGEDQRREDRGAVLRLWPPYPAGAASEPSYIPLGGLRGTEGDAIRLDVQDIMMMERVPRVVVLMGCATGVHDERTAYGGFSLATAFMAAGSEIVVASTREVDGQLASLVGRGLYERMVLENPGEWLRGALRSAMASGLPEGRVGDYRVYVR